MAGTNTGGISELGRLLSLEPFPLKPVLDVKDIAKTENNLRIFFEQLERYLKRLTGKFGEFASQINQYITNQITTISSTGSFILKIEKHYTYASKPSTTTTVTLDSAIDWRAYTILASIRCRDVVSDPGNNLVNNLNASARQAVILCPVTLTASYPLTVATGGAAIITAVIKVSSTGVLQLVVTQSPAASTAYIDIFAAAIHLTPAEGSAGAVSI
jgi:hypothetical protein